MNHRSNVDYVVVAYVLAYGAHVSYAVGEWARVWPLEYVFKSFGSYFIRRGFREPLYHAVLEEYVHLITRNGVTQGFFPEGRLSRDGRLGPPKLGLLDYVCRTALDPAFDRDIWFVPVAINFDRVLEDRALIRELVDERDRPRRLAQLWTVATYVGSNALRLVSGRLKRYGRAAVNFGTPVSLKEWLASAPGVLELPKERRLPELARLAALLMERIGAIVPVTPVPLAAAALLSFGQTVIPERAGPEAREAGGAASGGEGAGHLRDLGFASPRGCVQHSVGRGHAGEGRRGRGRRVTLFPRSPSLFRRARTRAGAAATPLPSHPGTARAAPVAPAAPTRPRPRARAPRRTATAPQPA